MDVEMYEHGFRLSKRINDDYIKLGKLLVGDSSMEEYLRLKNEIMVLINAEKTVYDKLNSADIQMYLENIVKLITTDASTPFDYDYRRYTYNLYTRSNDESLDMAILSGIVSMIKDLDIYGMINIETMRLLRQYIDNAYATGIGDQNFRTRLYAILYMILPGNMSYYSYSEKIGLKYDYNLDKIPRQDIKEKVSLNKGFDHRLLMLKIRNDITELVSFSEKDTSIDTIFNMLYDLCRIEVSVGLLTNEELAILTDYYTQVSANSKNIGNTALKRIFKKDNDGEK